MRALRLLVCLAAACATPPVKTAPPTPPPSSPAPRPQPRPLSAAERADALIKAQLDSDSGAVTDTFAPVREDLQSGDDARVLAAMAVVQEIGARVTKGREAWMARNELLSHGDGLQPLVDSIYVVVTALEQAWRCSTVVEVGRAAVVFRVLHHVPLRSKASVGGEDPNHDWPKEIVTCRMKAVNKDQARACFAHEQTMPDYVLLNVVVGRSGTIDAVAAKGEFAGTPAGACVERVVKAVTFPPSRGLRTPWGVMLKEDPRKRLGQ